MALPAVVFRVSDRLARHHRPRDTARRRFRRPFAAIILIARTDETKNPHTRQASKRKGGMEEVRFRPSR